MQVTKLNQQAYMKMMLLINHKAASGKASFGVVKNCKMSK